MTHYRISKAGKLVRRRNDPEHDLQVSVIVAARRLLKPNNLIFAIPNGGKRSLLSAIKLKRSGVLAGVPDLCCLMSGGKVAWLELKAAHGSLAPAQREFRDTCLVTGHLWGMARTLDQALYHLDQWGALRSGVRNAIEHSEAAQ